MLRAALILVGLVLAVSAGVFALMRGPAEDSVMPPTGAAVPVAPEPAKPAPPPKTQRVAAESPQKLETKSVRQIAPDTIVAPAASDVTLVREEPRPPLGDLGLARKRPYYDPDTQKGPLLRRPLATSAGEIEVDGYRIRLAGIVPTAPDKTCPGSNGNDTPCGMRARTAFRQFLRGRAIRCDVPDAPTSEEIVTTCALAKTDLGAWLVRYGWALPDGDRYKALADEAREKRRGLLAAASVHE